MKDSAYITDRLEFVILDEFSLTYPPIVALLIFICFELQKRLPNLKFLMFGDVFQCKAPHSNPKASFTSVNLMDQIFTLNHNRRCLEDILREILMKIESGQRIDRDLFPEYMMCNILRKTDLFRIDEFGRRVIGDFTFISKSNETNYLTMLKICKVIGAFFDVVYADRQVWTKDKKINQDYDEIGRFLPLIPGMRYFTWEDNRTVILNSVNENGEVTFTHEDGSVCRAGYKKLAPKRTGSQFSDGKTFHFYQIPLEMADFRTAFSIQGEGINNKIFINAKNMNRDEIYVAVSRAKTANIQIINV